MDLDLACNCITGYCRLQMAEGHLPDLSNPPCTPKSKRSFLACFAFDLGDPGRSSKEYDA